MEKEQKLQDNDRIAIIGAGPAGSLFAYILLSLARQENRRLRVTLYDPRDFTQAGPAGCNGCVGVINGSLWQRLQRIGIDLDQTQGLIQSRLGGYLWSTSTESLEIKLLEGRLPSRTVFRGSGPRFSDLDKKVSFDQFLLERALEKGAQHQQGRISLIERIPKGSQDGLIQLTVEKDRRSWQEQAELVVGAFGLNRFLMEKFENFSIGYRPPQCVRAVQIELTRRPDARSHTTDDFIQVINIAGKRVRQLVLTPKGKYATLTLLAPYDLHIDDLNDIRKNVELKKILESGWDWPKQTCLCQPLLQKYSGKNFYDDRVVLIGDAACSKYFKNGLESALRTAGIAAQAVLFHGINRKTLRQRYYTRVWWEIIHDNIFGRFLLKSHNLICNYSSLMSLALDARDKITRPKMQQHQDDILWDVLTGNRPYRHIFYRIIDPYILLDTGMHLIQVLNQKLHTTIRNSSNIRFTNQKEIRLDPNGESASQLTRSPTTANRSNQNISSTLDSGARVSIIGGGPAGASCAISLLQLARRQNINLEVTIHDPKDFAGATAPEESGNMPFYDKRVNQCIGVLSPPIHEILTEKLNIDFPQHLVQKSITGYVLHGQHQTISLDELHGVSFALRRITFDDYMIQQALRLGAHLNLAEAVQIERTGAPFKITTTNGVVEADVVVGAFGVDHATAGMFERCFAYRRPQYMHTIITKRHPSKDFLRQFGHRIHAFLPPLKEVEFGAITPKLNHLSINIAGRQVNNNTMHDFLALPQVARLLPPEYSEKDREIFFPGCFPTSPAQNFLSDRMIIIGDASGMLRPFKGKGVNSAIIGGITAAQVMIHRGLSADAFKRYYLPVFHQIKEDMIYARTARWLTNVLANRGGMDLVLKLAQDSKTLQRALTEAVSGAGSYKTILQRLTNERILWRSGTKILKKITTEIFGNHKNK